MTSLCNPLLSVLETDYFFTALSTSILLQICTSVLALFTSVTHLPLAFKASVLFVYYICTTSVSRLYYPRSPCHLGTTSVLEDTNVDIQNCLWISISCLFNKSSKYTVKNGLPFSRPQPGCHWLNSPWAGICPARESLVSDIPAGDGKIVKLFYSVW